MGGGGVEDLSGAGFGKGTSGLVAVPDFAVTADFGGIGLSGEFSDVALFADDSCGGRLVSDARSSSGSAVSIATDGLFVTSLLLVPAGSKVGFS